MPEAWSDTVATVDKTLLRLLICDMPGSGDAALIGSGEVGGTAAEERRSCIFGDSAWRSFSTARRAFSIVAGGDATLALVAAASGAEVAVLSVDASRGVSAETRRQLLICSLFGVRHIVLAVDRLDRIGFEEAAFERIAADYFRFAGDLGFASLAAIPLPRHRGDNIATASGWRPWYRGPSLLEHLEGIKAGVAPAGQPAAVPSEFADQFAAHLVWVKEATLVPGRAYWLEVGARRVVVQFEILGARLLRQPMA